MSFMYYKKVEKTKSAPAYGFEKKSAKEVHEITERLTRNTYNRRLSAQEAIAFHNYNLSRNSSASRRTPSSCGHRSAIPERQSSAASRRINEREMQRLIRRLQRPTESYTKAIQDASQEDQDLKEGRIVRPKYVDENVVKILRRISRPTTASLAKDIKECHLCHDHENKKATDPPDAFDYEYGDTRSVAPEEMDYIVSRVRIPTCSSAHGRRSCSRTPVMLDEVKIRENLPLVSGLRRSKNVKQIVDRLHPPPFYRMVPAATQITVYG